MSTEDGLTVKENEDGSFTLEWDKNDPRYAMFNQFTEKQITAMLQVGLQQIIKEERNR